MTQIYCDIADIRIIKIIQKNSYWLHKPELNEKNKNYEIYSKEILKVCKINPFHSRYLLITTIIF